MEPLEKRLKVLNAKKESLFLRVQLLYNDSKRVDEGKVLESFLIRYSGLEQTKDQFCQVIDDINSVSLDIDQKFMPNFEPLNSFDELYCHIQSVAKSVLKSQSKREFTPSVNVINSHNDNNSRLPRIDLPIFSGLVKDWPIFYECFLTRVHENKELSDVDRVHYLISRLSGKALAICSGIPPTGANYNLIWQALVEKYDDKRLLANSYLDQMFEMKTSAHESSETLNNFLVNFDAPARALQQLKLDSLSDYILTYLALKKLNPETLRLFENSRTDSSIPVYKEVITFVEKQAKVCSRVVISNCKNSSFSSSGIKPKTAHSFMGLQIGNTSGKNSSKCSLCNSTSHVLARCSKFLDFTPLERYSLVKEKGYCLNCLGFHKIANCQCKTKCRVCGMKHNTLLHFGNKEISNSPQNKVVVADHGQTSQNASDVTKDVYSAIESNLCSTLLNHTLKDLNSTVLLGTAVVDVIGQYGELHKVRLLIDSGSQQNILTIHTCRRLGLRVSNISSTVKGIGSSFSSTKGLVQFVMCSRFTSASKYTVNALVVDKITDNLPQSQINISRLSHLHRLPLADSSFHLPGEIHGILAADLYVQILGRQHIVGPPNTPIAMETTLGFVVMGKAPTVSEVDNISSFCTFVDKPLEILLQRFWELEQVPAKPSVSPDDLQCENIFSSTYHRQASGKYSVTLPFKSSPSNLGDSYSIAYRRFLSLEKRFRVDPLYREQYGRIFGEYITAGYLKKVENTTHMESSYYIPHHGIFKAGSTSTPMRVVYDASAKSDSNYSLNDLLYSGPKLQNDILKIFLNFRLFKIAFTADIRQMYLQIKIATAHQCFQRVLWRFQETDQVEVYELTTVTFGVKSSPFLALRTVHQLIEDEGKSYSLASEVAKRDMYVDDLLSSVENLDKGRLLFQEITSLFRLGGFDLVKWAVNSQQLLEFIPCDYRAAGSVSFDTDFLKVLGMQWHPNSDNFSFRLTFEKHKCTKRSILSITARVFDLLGILAPVILKLKLFIKQLWTYRIGWDDTPPLEFVSQWQNFEKELPLLESLKIPRHLGVFECSESVLIGFADACETSYGAVVYIRTSTNGDINTNFVCAKSKVSPLKTLSIPRLELCAAHLLAKLLRYVMDSVSGRLTFHRMYALSDSTVALNWICSSPHRWKIFVSHRVAQIQELIPTENWYHVNGEENISDMLSRGVSPSLFIKRTDWLNGPPWLKQNMECWPIRRLNDQSSTSLEQKVVSLIVSNCEVSSVYSLIQRCSSWRRLLRIVVYLLRFVRLLPRRSIMVASDLDVAERYLIKVVQSVHFSEDIRNIRNKECGSSKLRKLRPFLQDNVLRVGGRLINSQLSFDSQHPVLLPKHDQFVDLLVDYYHRSNMHTGPNLVLALLRQKYWILSARGIVRGRISKCNYCFRFRPKSQHPLMGDLPSSRVIQAKPFLTTGVDYAGPISIIFSRKRGVRPQKAYICLFVCMCTKAVHIELVSDLSTANFLQAFKRFLSRRGLCSTVLSDQGTNFIGAKTALKDLYSFVTSKEFKRDVGNELAHRGIEWKLNPPASPHFGGLWETAVKSVKSHLVKVVGTQLLTYEEMNTVLVQIEALLNSRPLCELSSDPSESLALTPAHFLTLTPLDRLPMTDVTSVKLNRLDRFQLIDRIVQDYWKRWHIEYLSGLQARQRWNIPSKPIAVGQLVLFQLPNSPPLHWPMGRIIEIFPGPDGITRVVSVRTKSGTFRRPVVKVCPLPSQ